MEADDPDTLHRLIDETLEAIDRARTDWSGWRDRLNDEQRRRLKALEREVDAATLAEDRRHLESALEAYQNFTLSTAQTGGRNI